MAVLEALLGRAVQGQGHMVGIMGEPGMGKSRLLYEFVQRLSGKAVTYVEGHCLSYSTTPYLPVLDLLRQLCGITDVDDTETVTAKVHRRLGDIGGDLSAEAPYLLRLLGVPEGAEELAALSPQALKSRTFATLQGLSIQRSRQQPLVLAVENLHWIDPTSEEWLASLVESLAQIPLLLLTTYRPGYRPLWMDKSYATQIALTRLTPEASRAVVESMFQTQPLSDALRQEIVGKAAGNPFFLEELTRAVVAHGDRHATLVIPDTVQAVLAARMDQVPSEEKRLLQAAAVIGMDVPLPLLQAVAELPDDVLYRGLAHLRAAEFLYETRPSPDHAYTFTHALTRQVAYDTLLTRTRQRYHQRTAQVLAERFPDLAETQPELLAQHYAEAGLAEEAVGYWQRAGERSRARSADVEAVAHLTRGLDALRTLPDTPARAQRELDMQLMLGRAFAVVKGFAAPETGHAYDRARELCQQLGDPARLFAVLVGLREFYLNRGELHTARELAEACLPLAQRQHDAAPLMRAHFGLGSILYYLGELVPAWTHLEQAIALYTPQQDRALIGQAPLGVPCFARAALTLWRLGYPDQALARSAEMLTLAQELSDAYNLARALVYAADVHHLRREWCTAQEQAAASLALSTEQAFVHWVGPGTFWRGWALAAQGQGEEGVAQMQQGMAARQATGNMLSRAEYLALLAEADGRIGQAEAGLCLLAEALAVMDQTGARHDEPELYRIKGELLLRQAVPDELQAEACFQQALAVARRRQAKSWELRAAISLGRLWQRQGQRVEALELLALIYGWFTEGFDTADLREAKALLEELS
jgi:predicted ATPase